MRPAALLVFAALPLSAQTPVSWEEAESEALRRNPELAASLSARDARRHAARGSYNGLMPRVGLSNGLTDSKGATGESRWSADGTVSVDLFDMGRVAAIRSAHAGLDRAKAQLWLDSAQVRLELRRAFLELLLAQENIAVSRRIAAMRHRGAELVALRYDSGRESRGNRLRASAQALQADVDLRQAERSLRVSGRALNRRIGYDELAVTLATGTLSAAPPPELPQETETLLSVRPELAVRQALIKSAEAGVGSARSALWPSLSARYSRTATGRTEFPNSRYGWTAGATLSLPLFGGGPTAAYHDIAGAQRELEGSKHELRAARGQALLEIESAWSDYARASDLERVQSALLEAARQRNEEADIRYASGLLSYDNWEIISSDRVGQERQALQARLNAAAAQAQWERALGRRLGE